MTSKPEPGFATLVDVLRHRASAQPGDLAYNFLADGESTEVRRSYADVDAEARSIATVLQDLGLAGERAVLLYPPEIEYISAFFGCLYAGVIAVPAYPPDPSRLGRTLPRLQAIVADAEASVVLTTSVIHGMAQALFELAPDLRGKRWIATDAPNGPDGSAWRPPSLSPDSIAFLQYTSGSTGSPKGVVLSHENLLHNLGLISRAFEIDSDSVGVSWLPPYHDMGLIGGILAPMYRGRPTALMSPIAFLQRPVRWLKAITKYRATISGGPNFAYELCLRKVTADDIASLDLSCWQLAFSGAEPVSHETLAKFVETFGPCGFERRAFYPCYGLAEATLLVTGGAKTEEPAALVVQAESLEQHRARIVPAAHPGARRLVSCGRSRDDQDVVVVRPHARELCAPMEVGEIWVRGPSVARGYWRKPEDTEETFGATVPERPWPHLRTGDLGFLHRGEVFVTGRLKDLIIVRGRNFYPQDLEHTAEQVHASIRRGCCAAFGITIGDEEKVVIALEIERRYHQRRGPKSQPPGTDRRGTDRRRSAPPPSLGADPTTPFSPADVADGVIRAIGEQHDVLVHGVVLVVPGGVPKTSSGKTQRRECKSGVLAGTLDEIWRSESLTEMWRPEPVEPDNDIEPLSEEQVLSLRSTARLPWVLSYLQAQVARALRSNASEVDVDAPISSLGLDSLQAIMLTHDLERSLGAVLPAATFLREDSLRGVANSVLRALSSAEGVVSLTRSPHDGDEFELSEGQLALWFLHQIDRVGAAYNVASAIRLKTMMPMDGIEAAFEVVTQRHGVLRSRYATKHGRPVQRVEASSIVPFVRVDATGWTEDAVSDYLAREVHRPFDLEAGPVFRISLLSRSASEHVLFLGGHHIAVDMWSLVVILGEIRAVVSAPRERRFEVLPVVEHDYRDFVHWQARYLASAQAERSRAYWLRLLDGTLPVLDLPADRRRPANRSSRGAAVRTRVSSETVERLKAIALSHHATLYMVLLAAFDVWVQRHTGLDDFLVGSPVAGRARAGFDSIVGYFVNPLVHRADLSGSPGFVEVLARVRESALDGLEHQDFPFGKLVEALKPARDPSRTPVFQVMFVMEKAQIAEQESLSRVILGDENSMVDLGGAVLTAYPFDVGSARFDLSVIVSETEAGLSATFQYSADLFERATMERMAARYGATLESIAAEPTLDVRRLACMTTAERVAVLDEWNDTADPFPTRTGIQLFEDQVARTPDAVAVTDARDQLTFIEVDRRANRMARALAVRGVRRADRVGLLVGRSVDAVVGIVAIWKAGAAYVPLDVDHPQARIDLMLRDAGARVAIAEPSQRERVPGDIACIGFDDEEVRAHTSTRVGTVVAIDDPAYVIYTSGSTGTPKGVVATHRGLANLHGALRRAIRPYRREGQLFVSLNGPLVFDTSVKQLVQLFSGHAIRVTPGDIRFDADALLNWLCSERVDVLDCTPSQLRLLAGRLSRGPSAMLVGGEAIDEELWSSLAALPGRDVYNLYGPTECTVDVTACRLDAATGPSLGRALANVRTYVLNDAFEPVPIGVPGELVVGGEGVTLGYLGSPDATADRFVPDPFSGAAGARLYRTGDRARWLADGTLEFLGRADDQLKIRGYRVEPAEIERNLATHPVVRLAVVSLHREGTDEPRLVAYVVLERGSQLGPGELQTYLGERLPTHMVPRTIVTLDAMPLTANGKVDKGALPAPGPPRRDVATGLVGPRNAHERDLASIWRQVLRLEEVGVHDNFFSLGGDSILSIQIVSRAAQVGMALRPNDLFRHQTIAELAAVAEKSPAARAPQGLVTGVAPLTPIQRRFFEDDPVDPHHHNQAVLLEAAGDLDVSALQRALDALVVHHDALRLRFQREVGEWAQRHDAPSPVPMDLVELVAEAPGEVAQEIEAACGAMHTKLDLSRGPTFRALRMTRQGGRDLLFLVAHHLVVDAVSWRILVEDLSTGYEQARRGIELRFPLKTTSYKEWAERAHELVLAGGLHAEQEAWKQIVDADVERLPRDAADGPNDEASSGSVVIELDAPTTQSLLGTPAAVYRVRPHEVILGALSLALGRALGGGALRIDLEGHGRDAPFDADASRTVGWFTSVAPVVLETRPMSPRDALLAAKEAVRSLPNPATFGMLRHLDEAEGPATLGAAAPSEIVVNYLGRFDEEGPGEAPFRVSRHPTGPGRSPRAPRRYVIELIGAVFQGRLQIELKYATRVHHRATVEAWAEGMRRGLEEILEHCRTPAAGGFTPADFPLVGLAQGDIDRLFGSDKDIEDAYPVTPMQAGMLFHALYADRGTGYLQQFACTFDGDFDRVAFERSWSQLLLRHAALRTEFRWERLSRPIQIVRRRCDVAIEVDDVRHLEPDARSREVEAIAAAERTRGFDLSQSPLMRWRLVRLDDRSWRFIWTHHHLVVDGWSISVVFSELFALYTGLRAGSLPVLPPAPRYRDYIAWLSGKDSGEDRGFWQTELMGFSDATPVGLPGGRYAGDEVDEAVLALSAEETAALDAFARAKKVTVGVILQAAWGLVLSRLGATEDVVFGAPVAGRAAPVQGLESMVGVLINTVPIRIRIGDEPLLEWLHALQEHQLELRLRENAPLPDIHRWSEVPRDRALFDSLLIFENYPLDELLRGGGEGLSVSAIETFGNTNYALTVYALPGPRLTFRILTERRRFTQPDIEAMKAGLRSILDAIVTDPSRSPREIASRVPVQRLRVCVAANFTADSIAEPLAFCLEELKLPNDISFAPYNQVFQELLDPGSHLASNREGVGVILLRPEDWVPHARGTSFGPALAAAMMEFVEAFEAFRARCDAPCLVAFCPPSDELASDAGMLKELGNAQRTFLERHDAGVLGLDLASAAAELAVTRVNDPRADALGHVPYSDDFFAAAAVALARSITALGRPGPTVVIVDADDVLWPADEEGPADFERLDASHETLQAILLDVRRSGLELCLTSRNDRDCVVRVFRDHPEMPLRAEHFSAIRIDWSSPASNVQALAEERGIALEHVVYLSRDAAACAEVRSSCPAAMTIQLPSNGEAVDYMLRHWGIQQARETKLREAVSGRRPRVRRDSWGIGDG